MEAGIVCLPGGDRVVAVDARGFEDCVPEFGEGCVGRVVGEDGRGPRGCCAGHDGPVDGVAGDQLKRGAVGLRDGTIGAADFGGIFICKQSGIAAGDCQTRGATFEGRSHSVVEPIGGTVEAFIRGEVVTHERGFIVAEERCDQRSAGAVGLLCNASREGQGIERGGHEQFLTGLEAEADTHCNFGKPIEFVFVCTWGGRDCRCTHLSVSSLLSQDWAGRQSVDCGPDITILDGRIALHVCRQNQFAQTRCSPGGQRLQPGALGAAAERSGGAGRCGDGRDSRRAEI